MEVTCPDGVGAGDVVAITAPDGREYHVAVPEGVHPGDTFIADIAAPPDETADVDEVNVDAGGAASEEPPHEGEEPWPAPAPVTIAEARGPMDSRELVLALVEHAQKVLENEMQPFLEAKVHLFDQAMEELMSGHGETLEQYAAFKDYERELERHFDTFVAERGFASAAECFAAIDGACVADLARRTREMDELQRKLREALRLQMQGAEDDPDGPGGVAGPMVGMPGAFLMVLGGGDGGERGGVGRSGGEGSSTADAEAEETVPLLLFSQPISLKDMIEHALNLGEYTTFSGIMRMKAKQVRARPCRAGRHGVVHTRGVWARDGAPDRDVRAAVGSAPLWGVSHCGEGAAEGMCAAVGSQVRMRRAFLVEAEARAQLRESRLTKLETVDVSSVRWLWAALNGRLDKHLAQTMPPPLLALMRQEAEMEVRLSCDLRATSIRSRCDLRGWNTEVHRLKCP